MDLVAWLQLTLVCFLGAVSPGPSLAVVMNNTLSRGRSYGVATSMGHAVGIWWWALLTAIGVAALVALNSPVMLVLQTVGACLLIYIGIRTFMARNDHSELVAEATVAGAWVKGAIEGFLISLFNPKIALFFIAIFSHLVGENPTWVEIGLIGLITAGIDGLWYAVVALVLTTSSMGSVIQSRQNVIAAVSGIILVIIAIYLLASTIHSL